ncbi:MAG: hypothetical protein K8L97_34780 [Anaerolineae bacterium]|nr:hypothetical protein [Anaerolineae bacterium]
MEGISAQQIIAQLGLNTPPGPIWNIMLYIVFILAVVTMFMQGDKQNTTVLIMGAVGLMAVVAKLQIFPPKDLGALVVNAGMFTLPLIVAGVTNAKKSVGPAILCAIVAGIYFFGFWVFMQRT